MNRNILSTQSKVSAGFTHTPNSQREAGRKNLVCGFTLIEILLVIGIIAVLATVVIVALDPATRFKNARDARRLSDIQSILSAVHQHAIDNGGALPSGVDSAERQLGSTTSGCSLSGNCSVTVDNCLDLSGSLSKYLKEIPYDPANGSSGTTHYAAIVNGDGIVTVTACDSTGVDIASVSR